MHVAVSGLGAFGALFVLTGLLGARASGPISKDFPWQFRLAAQLRTPVLMFIVIPMMIQTLTLPLIYRPLLGGDPRNVLLLAGILMLAGAAATLMVRMLG